MLEVMSRFAVDPRWLVYLPPTMSPCATAVREGLLEHPDEAFGYFRELGVERVVCEEKHMGSRAVAVVCRNREAAVRRFGLDDGRGGVLYIRTGRPFFSDNTVEAALVERLRERLTAAGMWEDLGTDWVVIDAEILPWSAKAQSLLRTQYAPVGLAGSQDLGAAEAVIAQAVAAGVPLASLLATTQVRKSKVESYREAWRCCCWTVATTDDLVIAPFHLLATEGRVYTDLSHEGHMTALARLEGPGVRATAWRAVTLADAAAVADAVAWWEGLVAVGGEGMVVKPFDFVTRAGKRLCQPAVKCRGPEYLRLIYGPEYDMPANLLRLPERGLGGKRSLALKEFALGVEALDRFVAKEPRWRVHECVFGVLALETEALDPRL